MKYTVFYKPDGTVTPMTNAAELAAVKKQTEIISASLAELTDLFMNSGSKA